MMRKAMRVEDLERINTMSTLEAVAYANQLSNRLKCDDCTHEERTNRLELLALLSERVPFLKITIEPSTFCRLGWNYFSKSCG